MTRAIPRGRSGTPRTDAADCVRVNLLPASVRLRAVERRRRRFWTVTAAVLALGGCAGWGAARGISSEARTLRTETARVQLEIRAEERRIRTLMTQLEEVRQRAALLAGARASDSWSARLADFAAALPAQVVLSRLQITSPAGATPSAAATGTTSSASGRESRDVAAPTVAAVPYAAARIVLDGYAADHAALARFLQQLEQAGAYRNVSLVRSTSDAGGALLFGIECWR